MTDTATLTAGRELDRQIAERVMGWECRFGKYPGPSPDALAFGYMSTVQAESFPDGRLVYYDPEALPRFSTDIAAAWTVLDKLRHWPAPSWMTSVAERMPWQVAIRANDVESWWANIHHPSIHFSGQGNTLPLAICRAALAVVTGPS